MEKEQIKIIVNRHRHEKAALLAILHEVQGEQKFLDMDSLKHIAEFLKVSYAYVYGVATFYSAFSTTPKGETVIRVCDGIACHINGADDVIEATKSHLKIEVGETAWNEKYSLEKVECLGLCSVGPNASIDDKTHSKLDREKILAILSEGLEEPK